MTWGAWLPILQTGKTQLMKKLRNFIFLLLAAQAALAQQEPLLAQFFYNKTLLNPGATGSGGPTYLAAFYRDQWVGLEGAPVTQALSFQSALLADRVGLGVVLMNDRIGFFNDTYVNVSYAYRIAIGKGRLGVGMHASLLNHQADWSKAETVSGTVPAAGDDQTVQQYDVGAGAHYETQRFFVGVAMPHLLDRNTATGTVRHLFATGGVLVELSPSLKMRTAAAVRMVKNVPSSLDMHLGFGFLNSTKLWLGSTLRLSNAVDKFGGDALVLVSQYQLTEKLRAGFAYDAALSSLRLQSHGTYELMLEYVIGKTAVAVGKPRYF